MTEAELAAIQKRCEAATPGEWVYNGGEIVRFVPAPTKRQPHRQHQQFVISALVLTDPDDEGAELWGSDNDIAFVTHARADIPALLAEVTRLKALVEAAYREGWGDYARYGPTDQSDGMEWSECWDSSDAKRQLEDV